MSDDYNFYVTSSPPEAGRPFGGARGRTRHNPFDVPIQQSWDQRLITRDEWLEFKVEPADLRREINRIRAAGQHLKIGTEVRYDKETGRVAFRGCEYKPRVRNAPGNDAPQGASPDAPQGEGTWEWQDGSQR